MLAKLGPLFFLHWRAVVSLLLQFQNTTSLLENETKHYPSLHTGGTLQQTHPISFSQQQREVCWCTCAVRTPPVRRHRWGQAMAELQPTQSAPAA